jgi:rubrerythrin
MDELLDALKTALEMEKEGYDLYIKASDKTSNKLGKATLIAIAKKELDHIKAIEEFANRNFDRAIGSINPKEKKEYVQTIMAGLKSRLDEKVKKDSDLDNAYKVALELEKKSFNFYKDLKSRSSDAKAKDFFQFLMGEENTHYQLLQETLEYLDHPANWYREQERWIVEG